MSDLDQTQSKLDSLDEQLRRLREERKEAIEGNMGFSFGYDPAVAAIEQQMKLIQSQINSLIERRDQFLPAKSVYVPAPISPIQAKSASDINSYQKKLLEDLDALDSKIALLARELALLDSKLQSYRPNFRLDRHIVDDPLIAIRLQKQEALRQFVSFKNDKRFTFAVADLQQEVDQCRIFASTVLANLLEVKPALESECAKKRAKFELEQERCREQERLEQEKIAQEERERKERLLRGKTEQASHYDGSTLAISYNEATKEVGMIQYYVGEGVNGNVLRQRAMHLSRRCALSRDAIPSHTSVATSASNPSSGNATAGAIIGGIFGLFGGPLVAIAGATVGGMIGAAADGDANTTSRLKAEADKSLMIEREKWVKLIQEIDSMISKLPAV